MMHGAGGADDAPTIGRFGAGPGHAVVTESFIEALRRPTKGFGAEARWKAPSERILDFWGRSLQSQRDGSRHQPVGEEVRDIAHLLGVPASRVSQIEQGKRSSRLDP
jgi:transcriptional regulator with XRE-family HTH domain